MALIAGLLAVAACEPAPPPPEDIPELGEAFPSLPLPAGGEVVSRQGSRDALQVVIDVPAPVRAVAAMYRANLSTESWRLVSDTRDSAGAIILYAEGEKPLWVRIAEGAPGRTRVELSGAVPGRDTTYVRRREAASDTINTLRSRTRAPDPGE
ncbi:MAG TPA: hypothetical protein VFT04_03985 [Gemmatimonadales bacterium]|nr:hypothetical protein [Gemmatimonadales bacterium]